MHTARVAPEKTAFSARPADVLHSAERTEKRVASSYWQQLKDPKWQRRRLEIMQRDEFTCQNCFDSGCTLHVHHKHYVKGRKPWEYLDHELVTLCDRCHDVAHERIGAFRDLLAQLRVAGPFCEDEAHALVAGWASVGLDGDFSGYQEGSPSEFLIGRIAGAISKHVYRMSELPELAQKISALIEEVIERRG